MLPPSAAGNNSMPPALGDDDRLDPVVEHPQRAIGQHRGEPAIAP